MEEDEKKSTEQEDEKQEQTPPETEQTLPEPEKSEHPPDPAVAELQAQVLELRAQAALTKLAATAGVDPKAVDYLFRLVDISAATTGGKIDEDKLQKQLDKVLADLPMLRASVRPKQGVTPIGADGADTTKPQIKPNTVAAKRWNRTNY